MRHKFVYFLKSNLFKKIAFYSGIIFFVLSFILVINPQPFIKFGYIGVFVFNLFGTGTFMFPSLSRYMNIYWLSFATASGMLINDSITFLVGQSTVAIFEHPKKLEKIETSIRRFGSFALFFWSLIPIPYDFVGFVAGYSHMSYIKFAIPTFMGKFIRFILMGLGVLSIFKTL